MKILNIHNIQRNTLLFCRDDRGNRELIKDESFFPFFYEYDKNGKDRGYDGTPLRKVVVGQPNQIKELRSFGSFASDIPYKKLYITHKIKEFEKVKYRYCFIDIEVLAKKGCFPDPKKAKEPVTCITVYDSFTDSFKTFWILDYAKEGRLDLERAEKSLLEDFSSYLKKLDVDIILGWNVEFDYVFLHNRIKQFAKKISSVSLDRYGSYDMNFSEEKCSFPVGISILDYMSLFKKVFMRESSYALNSVCQKHLGEADWGETIFDINPKVKDKNLNDVKRLVKIEKKYNLLNYFDEIRRLSKVEWEDLYHNSSIIMSLIYEEARDKNIVLPNKQENIEDESFEGATRESSKTGALFNIGKYDLESAYPTMIINFCLDFQNIVSTPEANTVNVNGIYFKQNPDALVPSMVKKILTLKNNLKKAVKENPSAELKIKYNAIKAVANSAFGAFGNKYFRLYDNRITSSITYLVRDVLMYSKAELEKKGIETVYWDTDSVPKDTPILIKQNGTIKSVPIEDLYVSPLTMSRAKLDISKNNIEILTEKGFSKISYVYRHKTKKKMFRLYSRKGIVTVSEDHSLIKDGKSVSPKILKIGDSLELINYKFSNDNEIDSELAWVLGFWLAEGTTCHWKGKKYIWALVNQKIELLEKSKNILAKYGLETKILDTMKSSKVYKLVPVGNHKLFYELFSDWCLTKTESKKVPSFLFTASEKAKKEFLSGYLIGDGHIGKKDGIISGESIDSCIIHGISLILDSLNLEYSLNYRKDKKTYSFRLIKNTNDSRIRKENLIYKIETYTNEDYIYDVETENHHFCGGLGNVLLHNSVFLNSNEPLLDFLNETIQKWGKEKYGKDFISLKFDYEGYFEKLFLLAKCRYIGYLNKKGKIEQEIKGVEVKRVSSSKFEAQFQEQLINKILDGADKPTVEAFIKEKKKELREVPLEEVAFPCKQNGNIYKNNPIQKRCVDNTKLIFGEFDVDLGVVFYYTYVKGFGFDKNSKEINVLAFRRGEAFKIPKEKIDYEELERRNIDSKVDNIFEAMKWIKNKNENQMRLF